MNNQNLIIIRAEDQASQTLDSIGNSLDAMVSRLTAAAGVAAGAVAAAAASKMLVGAVSATTDAYLDQQEAARGLSEENIKYSASIQDMLGIQDETINKAMKRANLLGVEEEHLQSVTTAALGLSQVTGQNLHAAMLKTNEAINGNANAWASYLPTIREVETEEEKLAIIQAAAQRGLEDRINLAQSETGSIERRKAAMDDLYAAIGRLTAPSMETINSTTAIVSMMTDTIEQSLDSIAGYFGESTGFVSKAVDAAVSASMSGLAAVETVAENAGTSLMFVATAGEYAFALIERKGGEMLDNTIERTEWFADNFADIMTDIGTGTITVFANVGHNVGEIIVLLAKQIQDLPKMLEGNATYAISQVISDMAEIAGHDHFKGIWDGFEATAPPIPEWIESSITDRENDLLSRLAELGGSLGEAFGENFEAKMEGVQNILDQFDVPDLDFNLKPGIVDEVGKAKGGSSQSILESRLLTRGRGDDHMKQLVDEAKAQNKALEIIAANTEPNTAPEPQINFQMVS
ncbi:MAG: hypothetical protein NXI28_15260 [bacterium]|nr:hypothetical protein [bacterium]